AREVGIERKLGGQASVPGAAGTWRDLTDNVNRMAAALTTQVRAIAEVATAVTKGDLSRAIAVDAAGEVAALKDNLNEMIRNLRETTEKNTSQDWLKTNLAKFTRLLQGQRDLLAVSKLILSELAPLVSMQHGVFYINEGPEGGEVDMKLLASYAYRERKNIANRFRAGEGLVGQCAFERDRILLVDVPAGYIQINSGLGEAPPLNIVVLPVLFEGQVKAVIELASFQRFSDIHLTFFDQLTESDLNRFRAGEGLVGQCAFERDRILLVDVPAGYIQINSGLGEAPPLNIVVLPVLFEGQVKAVIELASFQRFSDIHLTFFDQLTE